MFDYSSIIKSTIKRISANKTLGFVGGLFILLGICISLTFGLSVRTWAFGIPFVTGEPVDANDPVMTNANIYLNDDATIDVSGLTADVKIYEINLQGKTLTITGNSQYKFIISTQVRGDGNLIVNGGNIEVNNDINLNNFTMYGGSFKWMSVFSVSNNVEICGGELINDGVHINASGLHAGNDLSISGGIITITDRNAGIGAGNLLSISGGTIDINVYGTYTSADGVFGRSGVSISGGNINITTSVQQTDPSAPYVAAAIGSSHNNISIQTDLVDIVSPENASVGSFSASGMTLYGLLNADGTIASSVTIRPKQNTNNNPSNNIGGEDVGGTPKVQTPPHVHSYRWEVIQSPTAESDGWEAYKCSGCGDIKERSPLPAMSVFDEEVIAKIKKAPLGGTVKIETTHWNSLGRSIRDALAARPDVTLCISFLSEGYRGIPLKVTLPAGTDIVGLFDENGYLGLCRAGSTLGYDN